MCLKIRDLHFNYTKSTIWISGDINLHDINWVSSIIDGNSNQLLIDAIFDAVSEQIVTFPTRNNNTLDLFITNIPSLIESHDPFLE
ncbi:hypothetical protein DPMN_011838 [Dreissena polymorpha]|uniref:Endonuclease/exonuclease/phosphatase domain-containing protein n=1 Tax=Dreissena polymorpha TaxID=45954 RepID=A0A9D4N4S4_DREPO|nr:hypothetical protein DPMN_011838 [Dreissena polymorpha]